MNWDTTTIPDPRTQLSTQLGNGVFGWCDPRGQLSGQLFDWAAKTGAERVVHQGEFQLWGWARSQVKVFGSGGQCGLVAGCPFGIESAHAKDAVLTAWRERRLPRLAGHFLLVLWEQQPQRLTLYRDDSSALGLYYREFPGGGIVFSDDLDQLVSSPAAQRSIARRSLHEYLRFMDITSPNTIYDGVYSTEPGVELVMEHGVPPVSRPHPKPALPLVPKDLESATDAFEARLSASIEKRLSPVDTTLVFLSGGVDSALIAALAARRTQARIQTYTIGFEEAPFDETPIASNIAHHLRLPHQILCLPVADYRRVFDAWSGAIAYPFADPAAIPTLLAYQEARVHATVALDGTGADTLLGIMPARHYRQASRYGSLIPRRLRPMAANLLKSVGPLAGLAPLVDFDDPEEILIRWRAWSRREIERLCAEPVSLDHTRFYQIYRSFPPNQHFERYSRLLGALPDDRIHEASRLTGLRVRFPFFDPDVVDFVHALSMSLRYRPGEHKRILKHLLARHIPRAMWDLPKHGFDFPFVDFLRVNNCSLVRDYLAPDLVKDAGILDPTVVQKTVERFCAGEQGLAFRIWTLTVLFAWLINHRGQRS